MTILALIQLLSKMAKEHQKRIFSLKELVRLTKETPSCLGMTLLRAQKKEIVARVRNVWINLVDPPAIEAIAFALENPSYVSFESALYQRGILSQSPRGALTVATLGRPQKIATPVGPIRFIHLKRSLFFGFDAQRIAHAEKAWLDMLYIRQRRGEDLSPTEVWYPNMLKRARLKDFARHYPRNLQRFTP